MSKEGKKGRREKTKEERKEGKKKGGREGRRKEERKGVCMLAVAFVTVKRSILPAHLLLELRNKRMGSS